MKTQEELRADFRRYLDADLLDEAEAVQKLIEPLSDEDWARMLAEAPVDDEPLTPGQRHRLDEMHRIIASIDQRQAG